MHLIKYLSHNYLSLSFTKFRNSCNSFNCIFISLIPSYYSNYIFEQLDLNPIAYSTN
nr:MAG TPA: hypothetical protein [Caudoviricetes sp.]